MMLGIFEAVFHTVIAMALLFGIALTTVTIIGKLENLPACGAKTNAHHGQIEISAFIPR
jgi:hypothetical protein